MYKLPNNPFDSGPKAQQMADTCTGKTPRLMRPITALPTTTGRITTGRGGWYRAILGPKYYHFQDSTTQSLFFQEKGGILGTEMWRGKNDVWGFHLSESKHILVSPGLFQKK